MNNIITNSTITNSKRFNHKHGLTCLVFLLLLMTTNLSGAGEKDHSQPDSEHNDKEFVVMSDTMAQSAGIVTTTVTGGTINNVETVYGDITIDPASLSHIRARFDGIISDVSVTLGDTVKKGEKLATVESNESLKRYQLSAPFAGRVIARHANAGELSNGQILFSIANYDTAWAQLKLFPRQRSMIEPEQVVSLSTADMTQASSISHIVPSPDGKPYTLAFVKLSNADGNWPIGTLVSAQIVTSSKEVALRVPKASIQEFEGNDVVFVKKGNEYHPRIVAFGVSDGLYTEVVNSLASGEQIVSENSYLIKADLEKSEAGHDH